MEEDKSPLHAPRPRTKRKGVNPVRCCIGITITFGTLICLAIGVTCFIFAKRTIASMRDPHKAYFVPPTNGSLFKLARPLIEEHDTFDIVLGIWAREPHAKVDASTYSGLLLELDSLGNSTTDERLSKPLDFPMDVRNDRIIFEETIFKNVKMDGKVLDRVVEYNLPTDILQDRLIFANDVRATLSIIPHVPEIEAISNFSDWRPDSVTPFSRLSEDFKHKYDQIHSSTNSLKWEALERIAISTGLLTFDVDTACRDKARKVDWVISEDEEKWEYIRPNKATASHAVASHLTETPYLFTRSHFYMIRESRTIAREDFEKKHNRLRKQSCGVNWVPPQVSRFNCQKDYGSHGIWETTLTIGEKDAEQDLRYGPYLDMLKKAAGPKHFQKLIPQRPMCLNSSSPVDTPALPEFIPVKYEVRFSTISPAQATVWNDFTPEVFHNFTATEKEKTISHNTWEQTHGVYGNKMTGTRPHTRFFLGTLFDAVLPLIIIILTLLYWATRQTSAGISMISIYCLLSGWIVDTGLFFHEIWGEDDYGLLAFQVVGMLWAAYQTSLIARLGLPYEISFGGGLKGLVRRKEPSHAERASRRVDTGPWYLWTAAVLAIWGITYLSFINRFHIIPSMLPPTPPEKHLKVAMGALVDSLSVTANIVQLVHNQKAKTFAGTYHIVAWLLLAQSTIGLLYHLPMIVGRFEVGEGLGLNHLIKLGAEIILVWQATHWSRVEQNVNEEDD